jgi:tRNA uridine 5-carbamoylmethylation protein Kti12
MLFTSAARHPTLCSTLQVIAMQRNAARTKARRIPDEVVVRMARQLEEWPPGRAAWDTPMVVLNTGGRPVDR